MSALKWPIRTLAVGESFVAHNPPKRLSANLAKRASELGIRLSIKRQQHLNPASPVVVTRVA